MPAADRAKYLRLVDASVATRNRVLTNPVHVGMRLRSARLAAGLRQADVAELAGMKRENVARAESGAGQQDLGTVERICTACGASVSDVFRKE